MKKNIFVTIPFCFGVLLYLAVGIGSFGSWAAGEELVILHTNDHHGALQSFDGQGGLPQRATLLKQERTKAQNVLLLDAGDLNAGSPVSNFSDAEPDFRAYQQLGYDAAVLGNHELDRGLPFLEKQMGWNAFPFLCANLRRKADGTLLTKPYLVKDFPGFRVGIFGITVSPGREEITYDDAVEAARKMVELLRNQEHVQLVIALTHLGLEKDLVVKTTSAQLVEAVDGIDLVVDGHSHTKMDKPLVVRGTPIVSAFEWGKIVGKGCFTLSEGKVVDFTWEPIPVTADIPADAEIVALIRPYEERVQALMQEKIFTTTAAFPFEKQDNRSRETEIGDLVCDGMMAVLRQHGIKADFAFLGSGSIRFGLPQGVVTYEDVARVLPFDDTLCTMTLSGREVAEFFAFVGRVPHGAGGFAQVSSEVRYQISYDAQKVGTLSDLTICGQPLELDRLYTIATTCFFANGGDEYQILKDVPQKNNTQILMRQGLIEYLRSLSQPVTPKTDGRIRQTDTKNRQPLEKSRDCPWKARRHFRLFRLK